MQTCFGLLTIPRSTSTEELPEFLGHFSSNIIAVRTESAEVIKHAINCFLAASITFMNEISRICEIVGADAKEVERDGIVVCTEWPQLLEVEWEKALNQALGRVVIDANGFIAQRVVGIPGLVYRSVGRPRTL